jgi:murein DD-endopeptidase MepM/ murein hydrolase activator NlpD
VTLLRLLPPAILAGLVAGLAAAAPAPQQATSRASAFVAQVSIPGQGTYTSAPVAAPPNATDSAGAFAYPPDGSVARVGAGSSNTVVQAGTSASAQATADALAVSLFGGEIAAESVKVRATAAAGTANATGEASTSTVEGLTVFGQPLTLQPGVQIPVADWATLEVLPEVTETTAEAPRHARAGVTGLRLRLVADHAGVPIGSEILIGSAEAVAAATPAPEEEAGGGAKPDAEPSAGRAPARPVRPGRVDGRPGSTDVPPRRRRSNVGLDPGETIPGRPPEVVRPAPEVTARFTAGGYVFPLFGPASFGDSFGAPRSDVSGGWHHGEDIIAPRGTPILAVADGTVFSVGWNDLGGWKLWLRDGQGNEFYFAHLSAFSSLAVEGQHVRAGDVLGFVGNTGDTSVMHLHFEIHPVDLLSLGYDGAIAPYPFLVAWRRAEDVSFAAGRRFAPVPNGLPRNTAPRAGAILLQADDISRASGLVPGALERALDGAKADEARLVPRSG